MSLGLHKDCLKRLSEQIAKDLHWLNVKNRMFLENWSISFLRHIDSTLPKQKPGKDKIEQYVSDTPVSDFVYESLSKELHQEQEYDSEAESASITQLDGYKDSAAVAERLVQAFESLPWEYSLAIKLDNKFGESFAKTLKTFVINDSFAILTPDEDFKNQFPIQTGSESKPEGLGSLMALLSNVAQPSWNDALSYLCIKTCGFIGYYGETNPLRESTSVIKAFCGIGIALRLFRVNYTYRYSPVKACFTIHRHAGNAWTLERTHDLTSDFSEAFSCLETDNLEGQIKTDEEQTRWSENRLKLISSVFTHAHEAEKILLASEWLFDSYCGSNELLSFVQTVVAMEILLGDKAVSDLMGLGELLRNRCAYLIGKSQKQRDDILNDFKRIYDLRCQIVHRGKSRLTEHERNLFYDFRRLCQSVIREEIALLQKDIDKPPRQLFGLLQTKT